MCRFIKGQTAIVSSLPTPELLSCSNAPLPEFFPVCVPLVMSPSEAALHLLPPRIPSAFPAPFSLAPHRNVCEYMWVNYVGCLVLFLSENCQKAGICLQPINHIHRVWHGVWKVTDPQWTPAEWMNVICVITLPKKWLAFLFSWNGHNCTCIFRVFPTVIMVGCISSQWVSFWMGYNKHNWPSVHAWFSSAWEAATK